MIDFARHWDKTLAVAPDSVWPERGDAWDPGLIVRTTGPFQKWDVVIVQYFNGGGTRAWCSGFSHKLGRGVRMKYMQYAKYSPSYGPFHRYERMAEHHRNEIWGDRRKRNIRHTNRVALHTFELPRELEDRSLADAGVRAFVLEALQAVYPAILEGCLDPLGPTSPGRR